MFPQNLILGAIIKIISNIINNIFENNKHRDDLLSLRDEKIINAQCELAKINNKDIVGKLSRSIIFFAIVGTYCFIAISCLDMLDKNIIIPIELKHGFFSRFVSKPSETTLVISVGTILNQFFSIVEMVIGFFVVPSRKR